MRACEQIAIRTLGAVIENIEGRTATLCYKDGMAVLKMYSQGRLVNTRKFPLYSWDAAREFGAAYIAVGGDIPRTAG